MDICLFCTKELSPESEEHVFLSALGARLVTYRATCHACNNSFATEETGKVDDALAKSFEEIRNGLRIWSGRDAPPPTLPRAGNLESGAEFDLAPGYLPIVRPGRLPKNLRTSSEHQLNARNEADAKRMLGILSKRGMSTTVKNAVRVEQKVPPVERSLSFDGPKVWRSVAKTAAVGFVVMFGNEKARQFVSDDLRAAIRHGTPNIAEFAGWDFANEWPTFAIPEPHPKTPDAKLSGFEHSAVIADVGEYSVAYVILFGQWRFSVRLGRATKLPARGLALNPRSTRPARFIISARAPEKYSPSCPSSFRAEHTRTMEGVKAAFDFALNKWSEEARADYIDELADGLSKALEAAGQDEEARATAITKFAEKLATIEHGSAWMTELAACRT